MTSTPRRRLKHLANLSLLATFLGLATFASSAAARPARPVAECARATVVDARSNAYQIAHVWSGVHTNIGAAGLPGDRFLIAYYNRERELMLASFDEASREVCRRPLGSLFGGWDAHNAVMMATAPDGTVHIAGNMHASPLVYASGRADDIASSRLKPMTGRDEDSVTYPRFFHDATGALLFVYRNGHSGDGRWFANRWTAKGWVRIATLFSDHDGAAQVSAYPTEFVRDGAGWFHVAIVWRHNYDVSSNFLISYAKTKDFLHWEAANGARVTGPVGPDSLPVIERTGENAGLINNAVLGVSATGQPIVIYTKYNEEGRNAVFAATPRQGNWQILDVADASDRAVVAGRGTVPGLPNLSLAIANGDLALVNIVFPPRDVRPVQVQIADLRIVTGWTDPEAQRLPSAFRVDIPNGLASPSRQNQLVRDNGVDGPVRGRLSWFAQGANNDQAHDCTAAIPRACDPPPSPLVLTVSHDR